MAKKRSKTYNVEMAHYMAEEYLRMANRSYLKSYEQENQQSNASTAFALSNFAFALEIYLKTIIFIVTGKAEYGHKLNDDLWDKIPSEIKEWLDVNFIENFKEGPSKWSILVNPSPDLKKETKIEGKTPHNSIEGILKSHNEAFSKGRYAFERPFGQKIDLIIYHLEGLRLLTTLVREMALSCEKSFEEAIKSNKGIRADKIMEVKVDFPKEMTPFPT